MTMLESGLPEVVDDQEELARFLTQSGHYNSVMVKPAAFLPNPKDQETSVSRCRDEPVEELWRMGHHAAGERTLYGAAFIRAGSVRQILLEVHSHEPPPKHAVIKGWPWNDDLSLQKAQQKELAIRLASAAGPPLLKTTVAVKNGS
ncbi:hypothetical protein FEM03_01010 [Phragmitibacter flavus]|uniref:Uncharacterized protein n=1 Tax=Phragmitibacter flavus TaxID=2576071 RepID=A0A5R8KL10_9BACT|nr:hypothetical protein [Phragmitibacter flavus]TLD72685.1 hypothetical protein FEM03_01010 [Phragmitibacter flavus]